MQSTTIDSANPSDHEKTCRMIATHKRCVADLQRCIVRSRDVIRESRELIARSKKQLERPTAFRLQSKSVI